MGRTGVTIEDVNRAAEAVQARGVRVTVARVREELQTGSMDTLTPLVREWKAQNDQPIQVQPAQPVVLPPPPTPVTEALEVLGQQVWKAASAVADLQLLGAYERHRNELAVAEENRQETAEFAAAVEAQNEDLKKQADELWGNLAAGQQREEQAQIDRAALEQELVREREERKVVSGRVNGLEQHLNDLNAQLDRLHTTLAGERDERGVQRTADQQQHAAALIGAAQEAKSRLEELRADLTRQLAAAGERIAGLDTQLQSSREAGEASVTELKKQLDQAKEEGDRARGALLPLREQLETLKDLLAQALAHPSEPHQPQVKPVIRNRPPEKPTTG